jgi:P-type Cu+ transporter
LAFILLGNYLEARATQYTSLAIEKLMKLQPVVHATVLRTVDTKKTWVSVSLEEVVVGDTIRVDPASQVPVDGTVLEGSTSIDESMVTGESKPVLKQKGDALIAGTINLTNSLQMKAKKIGKVQYLQEL